MSQIKTICILLCISAYCVQADKYTDENRPYEFGFTIEGEQHRHEKKDENGIIMGEFGFITADGVYHVTVYATDENGNFKILSMKNIRVKPYPTSSTQNTRQGHSLGLPSSPQPKTNVQNNNGAQNIKQERNSGLAKSCSHCSVPTTTTQSPKLSNDGFISSYNRQKENQYNTNIKSNPEYNSQEKTQQNSQKFDNSFNQKQLTSIDQMVTGQVYSENFKNNQPSREISTPFISNYPQSLPNYAQTYDNSPQIPNAVPQYSYGVSPLNSKTGEFNSQTLGQQGIAEIDKIPENNSFNSGKFNPKTYDEDQNLSNINKASYGQNNAIPQNNVNINRQPKSFNDILESVNPEVEYNNAVQSQGPPQPGINNLPRKPVLVAAQMQKVDKNTDIYHKKTGEKDGLPEGLTRDDMKQLLYTFNYTLGFHGHHEEGYTNGAKYGYYFVTGRNGIRTRVDYIADETGFHPKITQEILDVLSDDVPKPETEKDEKYGLRGYEFKWLYYPVDSS
ncbi:unnamed protein product [Euphydryas editha]|uniref:Cuticle protein n=1 Tax=Euphydryas editha TaxID=104508 RepID=A0AAU9VAW7_EUPED|nr:unnamed protein product [Euphydryas editha]